MTKTEPFVYILVTIMAVLTIIDTAFAAKRALVIANKAYVYLDPLEKPLGDAAAISAALHRLGFEVTQKTNLTDRETTEVISAFTAFIEHGDEVVTFFSGHGVAINGRNYLLPTDTKEPQPGQPALVTRYAVDAAQMIDDIRAKQPKYVFAILDACRDNPFEDAGKSIGLDKGLAGIEPRNDAFILFAAGPGEKALDRLERDDESETSVFTRVFVKYLEMPGLTLQAIARATQREVRTLAMAIKHGQFPDYSDRTTNDIVLTPSLSFLPQSKLNLMDANNAYRLAMLDGTDVAIRTFVEHFPNDIHVNSMLDLLGKRKTNIELLLTDYAFDINKKYKNAMESYRKLLPNYWKNSDWVYNLQGVSSPLTDKIHVMRSKVSNLTKIYLAGWVCMPHDCGENQVGFIVSKDGSEALIKVQSTHLTTRKPLYLGSTSNKSLRDILELIFEWNPY